MQSTQRYVIFTFLAFGVLLWATLAKVLSGLSYAAGWPDPALLGEQFTLTTMVGLGISIVAVIVALRNPQASGFSNEVVAELLKCTWPGKKETRTATVVVIVTSLIIAAILGLFDAVWAELTGLIYRSPAG